MHLFPPFSFESISVDVFLSAQSIDHTPNELFIELQELETDDHIEYYWNECARYERNFE